jgi:hypothetical protein
MSVPVRVMLPVRPPPRVRVIIFKHLQSNTPETVPALGAVSVPVPMGMTILVPVYKQLPGSKTNMSGKIGVTVIENVYLAPVQLKVPVPVSTSILEAKMANWEPVHLQFRLHIIIPVPRLNRDMLWSKWRPVNYICR